MSFAASPFAASPHRDVLEAAIPVDSVSQLVLLQELKNRAKAAVQGGQFPDAIALYQKALEVTQDVKEKSILEANLSLCHQKMSYFDAAVDTGLRATSHDPSYVKGWWRLGQAYAGQKRYDLAVSAMKEAIQLEPDNKAIRKEHDKFQTLQVTQPQPSSSSSVTTSRPTSSSRPKPTSTTSSVKSTFASTSTSSSSAAPPEVVKVDGEEFSASDIVRGYKVVNGKKTSYFHNELSQDAAKLIGDIAPKKLDPSSSAAPLSTSDSTLVSAWNKAGTWEERDVTTWAIDAVKRAINDCRFDWSTYTASVKDCEAKGHASVAMVRGKKRYIYELDLQVEWHVHSQEGSVLLASGKFSFPEVDGTCSGVYEADESISSCIAPLDRQIVSSNVCKHGLRDEIHRAINNWIELLKETY